MSWVKLDDNYADHPKVVAAGPLAAWLNVAAWCYAARYRTDGFVPYNAVGRLCDTMTYDPHDLARRLVEVGLWEAVSDNAYDGYRIHDYLQYNPSAADAEATREAARQRMQKVRKTRRRQNTQARDVEWLTLCATEPTTMGQRSERDAADVSPKVRAMGAKLFGLAGEPKAARLEVLAGMLDELGYTQEGSA